MPGKSQWKSLDYIEKSIFSTVIGLISCFASAGLLLFFGAILLLIGIKDTILQENTTWIILNILTFFYFIFVADLMVRKNKREYKGFDFIKKYIFITLLVIPFTFLITIIIALFSNITLETIVAIVLMMLILLFYSFILIKIIRKKKKK